MIDIIGLFRHNSMYICARSSVGLERLVSAQKVVGSSPAGHTKKHLALCEVFLIVDALHADYSCTSPSTTASLGKNGSSTRTPDPENTLSRFV